MAELRSYEGSLADKLRWSISDLIRALGADPYTAGNLAGKATGLAELLPVSGNILAGGNIDKEAGVTENVLNTLAAALPAGAGVAAKGLQATGLHPKVVSEYDDLLAKLVKMLDEEQLKPQIGVAKQFEQVPYLTGETEVDKILAPIWDNLSPEWKEFHKKNAFSEHSLAEAHDTLKGYNTKIEDYVQHTGKIPDPVWKDPEPALDPQSIAKALEKDPGASIFDIAGKKELEWKLKTDKVLSEHDIKQAQKRRRERVGGYSQFLEPLDWQMALRRGATSKDDLMPAELPSWGAIQNAQDLGFNLNLPVWKGGRGKHMQIPDPARKDYERGFFMADDPKVASDYHELESTPVPYYLRADNPAAVDWRRATGGDPDYSETHMSPIIEVARDKGHDLLVIKNIDDAGGIQNQYVVLDPAIVRAPGAKFDPAKKNVPDIWAGLGGAGVVGAGVMGAPEEASAGPAANQIDPIIESLRKQGIPVKVTSGYRDPEHNKKVGGASGSQHLHDAARDVSLKGLTEEQKRQVVSAFQSNPSIGGFGYYPGSDSIHVDVRSGPKAAWGADRRNTSVGAGWPDWLTASTRAWQGGATTSPATKAVAPPTAVGASTGPSVIATPTAPVPQSQGFAPAPSGFNLSKLVKGLGQISAGFAQPMPVAPPPMLPEFQPLPQAPAPPLMPALLGRDPRALKQLLDPGGLFLGLG